MAKAFQADGQHLDPNARYGGQPTNSSGQPAASTDLFDQYEEALRINEQRMRAQKEAFQAAMDGASLAHSLNLLVDLVSQETADQARCAFYIADAVGQYLHPVYNAGTMPESYLNQVEQFPIGQNLLACGLAVPTGRPVLTPDVFEEPLWSPWMYLADIYDFRGCWSFPIKTQDQKAVGTFAMYFQTARQATPAEIALIEVVSQTAAILIVTHTNVQERNRAEEALKAADRRKDEFLAMLGHELRNPLASLSNMLLILELTQGADESLSYAKAVELMSREVSYMTHLVDDLLDVGRIRYGLIQLHKKPVDLVKLVRQTVEVARPLFQQRQLNISLPPYSLVMLGDETRLKQVLMNLLTNGVKYTHPNGHVWVSLELVDNTPRSQQALLRVKDDGIGIALDQQEAIFDIFVQSETILDRPGGRLGLGLAVAKQLVVLHEGSIEMYSTGPGQGSEFTIRLPLKVNDLSVSSIDPSISPSTKGKGRVLVVDDNQTLADMTTRLVELIGYEARTSYSGVDALLIAQQWQPEVMLLDLGMPDMDGFAVNRQLVEQPWGKAIAVVALTGHGEESVRAQMDEARFVAYLLKPLHLQKLRELLMTIIDRSRSSP